MRGRGLALAILALAGLAAVFLARRPGPDPAATGPPREVAVVEGRPITIADLVSHLASRRELRGKDAALAAPSPDAALAILRANAGAAAVDEALELQLDRAVAEAAAATQPPPSDAEVEERIRIRRRRFERPNQPSLEESLGAEGMARLRREAAIEIALDRIAGRPSDEDVRRHFAERRDVWSGRRVRAFQILARAEVDAREARAELSRGIAWDTVCRERTIEKGTPNGDLGWVRRTGDIPDELARALFALERGVPSEPVKTRYGWHVVRWTDEEPGKAVDLEAVRALVDEDLARERRIALVQDLRKKARVDWRVRR